MLLFWNQLTDQEHPCTISSYSESLAQNREGEKDTETIQLLIQIAMTVKSIYDQSPSMESSDFDPMLNGQQPQQSEDNMVDCNHDHTADGAQSAVPAADSVLSLAADEKESVRQVMLERLSVTSAHFAHLQRDSPDLTQQEKIDIAAAVLEDNPATFLSRFGKYLQLSDLAYFQDADRDNYEVSFHLKEIRHRCSRPNLIVKNRRYAAMKELESGGEYFGEEAMKQREPLLYEQMVGQFLTDEEKERQATAAIDRSDLRFSTILLVHMDDTQRRELYRRQKESEECQEEEEEEEDSEEDDDDDDDDQPKQRKRTEMDEDGSEAEDTSEISGGRATDIWRQQLHEEFTAIMREQFLSGKDVQFDYSKVDDNPDYDSLATMGQDEEYQYFLAEPPQTVGQENSDSDRNSQQNADDKMEEEQQQEEEEDDYMLYEPPPDLVARSAHFVKLGSWDDEDQT